MNKLSETVSMLTNVGLLIGIVLVIYELRQNSIIMESEIYQQRTADLISVEGMIMESETLLEGLAKADGGKRDQLSEKELIAIRAFFRAHAHRFDNILHQWGLGTLGRDYLESLECPFAIFQQRWESFDIRQGAKPIREYRDAGFDIRPVDVACDQ